MKRQLRITSLRLQRLALGVSATAILVSALPAASQEQPRPSVKVLVYNIWNQGGSSQFWGPKPQSGNPVFSSITQNFLRAVNPDLISTPEINNNSGSSSVTGVSWGQHFASEFIRTMNEHRGTTRFVQGGDRNGGIANGTAFSYFPIEHLGNRRVLVKPDNGMPTMVFNALHLSPSDFQSARIGSAKQINGEILNGLHMPTISAGDFNAAEVSERGLRSARAKAIILVRDIVSSKEANTDFYQTALDSILALESPENAKRLLEIAEKWKADDLWLKKSFKNIAEYNTSSWPVARSKVLDAILKEEGALFFVEDAYPDSTNIPQTFNVFKKQNQILQLDRNREIFSPSVNGDGRSTWTSDGRDLENGWPAWDRSIIDHIISSRPFAKWTVADVNDPNAGILNGRTTNADGVDPSDHEPVAQNILWYGPTLTPSADGKTTDLSFSKEANSYNGSGEFILSRNNHRTDVRFDNISDDDGLPIYRDDVNAVGKLGRDLLNNQVAELISKGLLTPQEGLDYANDPNAALKMRIPCGNKDVLQTIAGAAELCVDSHAKFNNLNIKDGVVAFDEVAALGNDTGTIRLSNAGLRSAGPHEAWAQWGGRPIRAINKPIVIDEGIGSFEVSDPDRAVALDGKISGPGSFEKRGVGTLIVSGDNSYEGATIVNGGVLKAESNTAFGSSGIFDLRGGRLELGPNQIVLRQLIGNTGSIDMGQSGALGLLFSEDTKLTGSFSGEGTIVKGDDYRLTINGQNPHKGHFLVGYGSLVVGDADHPEASLASKVALNEGTSIGGIGSVGTLIAGPGSIIAPGNSVGTLRVEKDLEIHPDSRFAVEFSSDGSNDRIDVGGQARLLGGIVDTLPLDAETSYVDGQSYRLLNAGQGVEGEFERINSDSAFLDLSLIYAPKSVDLKIKVKKDVTFTDVADSDNEVNVAEKIEQLDQTGPSLELYNSLLPLREEEARPAFNALSGEIHASLKGALVDETRFARQAANQRLLHSTPSEGLTFWSDAYGAWGSSKGNGNSAKLDRNTGGLFIGGDAQLSDNWQLGLFGGYGNSSYELSARSSKASIDSYTLGAYAGTWFDPVAVRLGLANSWHSIDVSRFVGFTGFGESLASSYDARNLQVFGEVSSKASLGGVDFEPFLGLAYVNFSGDHFRENGIAGLSGTLGDSDSTFSTLGLRFAHAVDLGETKGAIKGSLAWQHGFGSVIPYVDNEFATGGIFAIAGAPIAKNAALIELGYDWQISDQSSLAVNYQGQLGSGTKQHGVNAKLQVKF